MCFLPEGLVQCASGPCTWRQVNLASACLIKIYASWLAEATSRNRDKLRSAQSLIMLTLRLLWHMRNACVFDNRRPMVRDLVDRILNEVEQRRIASAKELRNFPWALGPQSLLHQWLQRHKLLRRCSSVQFCFFISFISWVTVAPQNSGTIAGSTANPFVM
jgi:hypothetical protein